MKKCLLGWMVMTAASFFLAAAPSSAGEKDRQASRLSLEQMERVKVCRRLIGGADGKSLEQAIRDLERTPYIEENLLILEAVAKTYSEIALEYEVAGKGKQEWLHSMVMLNMAYLQLGGGDPDGGSALNMLINRKLIEHLPPDIFKNSQVFQPLM